MVVFTREIQMKLEEVCKDIACGSDFSDHLRSLYYFISRKIVLESKSSNLASRTITTVHNAYIKIDKGEEFHTTFKKFNEFRNDSHYGKGQITIDDYFEFAQKCCDDYNCFIEWVCDAGYIPLKDDFIINMGMFDNIEAFGFVSIHDIKKNYASKDLEKIEKEAEQLKKDSEKTKKDLQENDARLNKVKDELKDLSPSEKRYHELKEESKVLEKQNAELKLASMKQLALRGKGFSKKWAGNQHGIVEKHFFPIGSSQQDKGFIIQGIIEQGKTCNHKFAPEYAVIYAYLQRNFISRKSNYILHLEKNVLHKEVNMYNIIRIQILALLLIKYSIVKDTNISIRCSNVSDDDIRVAIDDINHYADILCRLENRDYTPLEFQIGDDAVEFTIDEEKNNCIEIISKDIQTKTTNRQMWIAPNPIYDISVSNKTYLEELAMENFHGNDGKFSFKPGQFEAIQYLLSNTNSNICTMPTGSGKSFIYYMVALLKSQPTIIISPTAVLIENQIQNLNKKHYIDDITYLDQDMDYSGFVPLNKLIYVTPDVFQNYSLVFRVIELDHHRRISNFVLDEVHCISNWGHDFRPDYLILSRYINEFAFNTPVKCFSGTANYTVLKDIMQQLRISRDDVLSPIDFSKDNLSIEIIEAESKEQVLMKSNEIINVLAGDVEKTIAFACNEDYSAKIYETIDNQAKVASIVFDPDERGTYEAFSNGVKNIMISHGDMGIGIDINQVKNVLHVGMPTSKPNFVQEIGRAGRLGEKCFSTVVFRGTSNMSQEERKYFDCNVSTDDLISMLNLNKNLDDLGAVAKLFAFKEQKHILYRKVIQVCDQIRTGTKLYTNWYAEIDSDGNVNEQIETYQRYFYILFRVGIVDCWFIKNIDYKEGCVCFYVERDFDKKIGENKKMLQDYISDMGKFPNTVDRIISSQNLEELIVTYVDWYYDQFVYHHRRQLFDLLYFFEQSKGITSNGIVSALGEYFSNDIIKIENHEQMINESTTKDVFILASLEDAERTKNNLEQALARSYSVKSDMFVIVYDLIQSNEASNAEKRLKTVYENLLEQQRSEFMIELCGVYANCALENKYQVYLFIESVIGPHKALKLLYFYNQVDEIYYGVLFHNLLKVVKE